LRVGRRFTAPDTETADLTPGTCMTRRIASISILIDSSSEMFGTRLMPGTTEPSFISGMKAVPRKGSTPLSAQRRHRSNHRLLLVAQRPVQHFQVALLHGRNQRVS
jgi:hypothetical protein